MHPRDRGRRRPAARYVLCLGALLAALAVVGGPASGVASADCTSGGSSCLPGSGYSFDSVWDCGVIAENVDCYANGNHTWGWGSASYSGSGSTYVCIRLSGYALGCGTNLARTCYAASCNDQSVVAFPASVENFGAPHTISGHAKA
ncbi:MAG TPA: hypothetical protein VFF79_20215 [Conexibacter sp.]|jgi:hypothetical protein|nr:hypothetical protein [Conexibacter sp.]